MKLVNIHLSEDEQKTARIMAAASGFSTKKYLEKVVRDHLNNSDEKVSELKKIMG